MAISLEYILFQDKERKSKKLIFVSSRPDELNFPLQGMVHWNEDHLYVTGCSHESWVCLMLTSDDKIVNFWGFSMKEKKGIIFDINGIIGEIIDTSMTQIPSDPGISTINHDDEESDDEDEIEVFEFF